MSVLFIKALSTFHNNAFTPCNLSFLNGEYNISSLTCNQHAPQETVDCTRVNL